MLIPIEDQSHVGYARRAAVELATKVGFAADAIARIQLTMSELASNLFKHARNGQIVISLYPNCEGPRLDIVALDTGPGITDWTLAAREGFSTAGTLGGGLAIIGRQADNMSVYSRPGSGTVVSVRFGQSLENIELGAICEPVAGETVCGDIWAIHSVPNGFAVFLADGIGHGAPAAAASLKAAEIFTKEKTKTPAAVLDAMSALKSTRGAVVAVAKIDMIAKTIHYAGIGNISGVILEDDKTRPMISREGIAGMGDRRAREYEYLFEKTPTIILHTDGLSTRWATKNYPDILNEHPAVLAGALFRDHRRIRDDATVLTVRPRVAI